MTHGARVWFRAPFLAALFAVATAGTASAGPVAFYDDFMPADVFFRGDGGQCVGNNANDTVTGKANGGCDTLTFSLFLPGYDAAVDTLYSALVTLGFHDDSDSGSETLSIKLDTLTKNVTITSNSTNGSPFLYSFWNPLEQLALDGRVDLKLTQAQGDFWFDGAGVAAVGYRSGSPTSVPEPSSLLLMSMGALALVARRRSQA